MCVFAAPSGVQVELEELRGRLRQAETEVEELKERLQTATASREQFRTMCLSLEESLEKEKEVSKMEERTEQHRPVLLTRPQGVIGFNSLLFLSFSLSPSIR